jgi:alkanesulfonate monooxygenase SsuD/methylene tetrahydromethanopterin reductase-like flavin-dependent oxidoreductase (luciferase family)
MQRRSFLGSLPDADSGCFTELGIGTVLTRHNQPIYSMPEALIFLTGNQLSADAAVAIAAGTNVAALSDTEANAKNRRWEITASAAGANMPQNFYRRLVIVDATQATEDAFVVINGGDDPATTVYAHRIEAGGYMELTRSLGEVGSEPMSVVSGGATATPIVVMERSAV